MPDLRGAPSAAHRVLASADGAHAHSAQPLDWRRAAAATGIVAATLALGIGVFALAGGAEQDGSGPGLSVGETAGHITVHRSSTVVPLSDPEILTLLGRAPDFGALDPQTCLTGLGHPDGTPVLGARPVRLAGRPAVLVVLPGTGAAEILAIVVAPDCDAAGARVLAETVLARP